MREEPCTDPYARFCGQTGAAASSDPILTELDSRVASSPGGVVSGTATPIRYKFAVIQRTARFTGTERFSQKYPDGVMTQKNIAYRDSAWVPATSGYPYWRPGFKIVRFAPRLILMAVPIKKGRARSALLNLTMVNNQQFLVLLPQD